MYPAFSQLEEVLPYEIQGGCPSTAGTLSCADLFDFIDNPTGIVYRQESNREANTLSE